MALQAIKHFLRLDHEKRYTPEKRVQTRSWPFVIYSLLVTFSHLGYLSIAIVETFYGPADTQWVPWSHVMTASVLAGLAILGLVWVIRSDPEIARGAPVDDTVAQAYHIDKKFVMYASHARKVYFLLVFLMAANGAIGTGLYYAAYGNTKPGDVSGGALNSMYALARWQTTFSMIQVLGFTAIAAFAGVVALEATTVKEYYGDFV